MDHYDFIVKIVQIIFTQYMITAVAVCVIAYWLIQLVKKQVLLSGKTMFETIVIYFLFITTVVNLMWDKIMGIITDTTVVAKSDWSIICMLILFVYVDLRKPIKSIFGKLDNSASEIFAGLSKRSHGESNPGKQAASSDVATSLVSNSPMSEPFIQSSKSPENNEMENNP